MCTLLAHEYGHLLGLPDEYEDPDCPDREAVSREESPWSVMNDHYKGHEVIDLYPRHLESLLRPLVKAAEKQANAQKPKVTPKRKRPLPKRKGAAPAA